MTTLATISDGATIWFCIFSFIAGMFAGVAIAVTHASATNEGVDSKWGEIDAAATRAYEGAHKGLETLADGRVWTAGGDNRARLLIFADTVLPGGQWWLDDDGARELLGVEPEEILQRLIPA